MFYGSFQTGGSLELYNPNNKDLMSNWEFIGKCRKANLNWFGNIILNI